jgi:hypothetical protein
VTRFLVDAPRAWDDIPLVKLVGIVLGLMLIYGAIKAMFGKKR